MAGLPDSILFGSDPREARGLAGVPGYHPVNSTLKRLSRRRFDFVLPELVSGRVLEV